ncbi:hypothetical protein SELMODRAFT_404848 [Selaginella moellendorffii]|uniref:Cyanovirin-N domain-containing protein n=1 Tax=Selaginella moellendorffii TaxID=88036 RepID=D8QXJ7_SELML|nr:hypothetical protein SELMODRAFT_404848 [Selaginella moellendorffii]
MGYASPLILFALIVTASAILVERPHCNEDVKDYSETCDDVVIKDGSWLNGNCIKKDKSTHGTDLDLNDLVQFAADHNLHRKEFGNFLGSCSGVTLEDKHILVTQCGGDIKKIDLNEFIGNMDGTLTACL